MLSILTPPTFALLLLRVARLPAASATRAGSCIHGTDASMMARMHNWRQVQAEAEAPAGLVTALATPARMQTATPTRPSELPSTWEVPDTFTFTALSTTIGTEPPLFKVTLFKSAGTSDEDHVANALLEIVAGMDTPRAKEIAKKVTSIGLALVGVWVEETADAYADALRDRKLVCDVSEQ